MKIGFQVLPDWYVLQSFLAAAELKNYLWSPAELEDMFWLEGHRAAAGWAQLFVVDGRYC